MVSVAEVHLHAVERGNDLDSLTTRREGVERGVDGGDLGVGAEDLAMSTCCSIPFTRFA
jgi:hypothetical protein